MEITVLLRGMREAMSDGGAEEVVEGAGVGFDVSLFFTFLRPSIYCLFRGIGIFLEEI